MIANDRMTPLFEACAEATEEAILNALCMATTTVGINDFTMHALPLDGSGRYAVRRVIGDYSLRSW